MSIHFDNKGCAIFGILIGFMFGVLISDKTEIHIDKKRGNN